jgi:glycosyltransferase involved in cell wall biosynthesis
MSVYIDLSEFLAVPMKTGIQRITGEICRCAAPNKLVPVRLHCGQFIALPPELIRAIGRYFSDLDAAKDDIFRLGAPQERPSVTLRKEDTVLVPELFGEERAAFFDRMPVEQFQRCRFVIYDLLPLTHPEYFPQYVPVFLSAYFRIVRKATNCGFISEYTQHVYHTRLKRTTQQSGVVLPLGSDALGPRITVAEMDRAPIFSVLGTVEPRKNHDLILEAFKPLLRQIRGLRLIFLGKMGWVGSDVTRSVQQLATEKDSGFEFYPALSDSAIRDWVQRSRATIYISAAEGYGLPPVESLCLGTPVIASKTIPSLDSLGSSGIHYVEPLTVTNVRRAVLAFLNDSYSNRKTEEAVGLELPTWQSFTQSAMGWCTTEL